MEMMGSYPTVKFFSVATIAAGYGLTELRKEAAISPAPERAGFPADI